MLQNGQSAILTLPHGQSAVNTPSNRSSAINTPYHGQSTVTMMLRDLIIPTLGNLVIPAGQSAGNMLRDLVITTFGDPMIPTGQSAINTLRALVLLPCHPAPKAWPSLLLHLGPITHVDVFANDFIRLAQGSPSLCQHIRHCILHAIDHVFAQTTNDTPNQKETVSKKKMLKGDGGWTQRKEILGWMLHFAQGTLKLTNHCKAQVLIIFDDLHGKKHVSIKARQLILGKL